MKFIKNKLKHMFSAIFLSVCCFVMPFFVSATANKSIENKPGSVSFNNSFEGNLSNIFNSMKSVNESGIASLEKYFLKVDFGGLNKEKGYNAEKDLYYIIVFFNLLKSNVIDANGLAQLIGNITNNPVLKIYKNGYFYYDRNKGKVFERAIKNIEETIGRKEFSNIEVDKETFKALKSYLIVLMQSIKYSYKIVLDLNKDYLKCFDGSGNIDYKKAGEKIVENILKVYCEYLPKNFGAFGPSSNTVKNLKKVLHNEKKFATYAKEEKIKSKDAIKKDVEKLTRRLHAIERKIKAIEKVDFEKTKEVSKHFKIKSFEKVEKSKKDEKSLVNASNLVKGSTLIKDIQDCLFNNNGFVGKKSISKV